MATNTFASNFSADAATYIAAKTLDLAQKTCAMYKLCDQEAFPKNESRTFQYTRYERVPLPQSKLTEGSSPSGNSMSVSTVTAVMDQWGDVIAVSDVSIDSVKHPVLQKAIEILALQAAETVDREICKVMSSGTNVFYPGSTTSRANITSTDKMASAVIGKVTSALRAYGAMAYDASGHYVGVWHPYVEDDILTNDTTFIDAAKYGMIMTLMNHEVGTWKGVRWIRSNILPSIALLTGASAADSATAGSLANSTAYDFKLAVVDKNTGFETFISATFSATTGMAHTSLDVTIPALPATATEGSLFRLYAGSSGGTLYKLASDIAASGTYNVGSIPTSGDVAQSAPHSGFRTYLTFVLGKSGLGCVDLNNIKAYLTPASASDSDPLVQRRKAGWKCDFKAVIKNDNFVARIETATTNGG